MDKEKILKLFEDFIKNYNREKSRSIWIEKSKQFREFWNNRILNNPENNLNESEVDQIIRILDAHAKGNTKNDEAVANCMIPQGVWYRMFNEIKQNKELQNILTKMFQSEGEEIIPLVDTLYRINEGKKNSLTGRSSNAINAMLFSFNPDKYVSVVSLNDRKKIIDFFNFNNSLDFEKDSQGKKVFLSNQAIIQGFRDYGIDAEPRTISNFLYLSIKSYWKVEPEEEDLFPEEEITTSVIEKEVSDKSLFYMEKELENFLIRNWERTELGEKYDFIEEEGHNKSQQYQIGTGDFIDILVKDRKSGQYVVIELKKNKTTDKVLGQLARYMGWIERHKSNGKSVKGIIIASSYDEKLEYALGILKKANDVKAYIYEIDFKLKDFKKN